MSQRPYRAPIVRLFVCLLALLAAALGRGRFASWGWAAAGLLLALGLAWPRLAYPLYRGVGWAGERLGRLLFAALALLVYLLLLFPTARLMRLAGRRFLPARREPGAATYFADAEAPTGLDKQY